MEIIVVSVNLMYAFKSHKLNLYSSSYGPLPGLVQLRLFNGLCSVFRTIRGLVFELSLELFCGLLWLDFEGVVA